MRESWISEGGSDRTYSASRLFDQAPGPVSPGYSLFAPSALRKTQERVPRLFFLERFLDRTGLECQGCDATDTKWFL